MSWTEILTGNGVNPLQWEKELFEEYIGMLFWKPYMGASEDAPIQLKERAASPGDTVIYQVRSQLVGGVVTGRNTGVGNQGAIEFYTDRVTIDNVRILVGFKDVPMTQKRAMFDVLNAGRRALQEKTKYLLEDDITAKFCDTSVGRVRGRYLYGVADSLWSATHTTALTGIDAANDMLTTSCLDIMKRKALIPVNARAKVRPMRVKMGEAYEEWFASVHHTYPIRDLVNNDAAWRNRELNLTARDRSSVLFTGSSFKGAWNGQLVYEWDRMPLISSTIQVAHSLLLGAQALALAWGQRSKYADSGMTEDLGHELIMENHEIRGIKKLIWDRNTIDSSISNEDNGQINGFFAAVAD